MIRRPLLRLLNLLVERLLADGSHDVYGNSFEPCSERHPKHFLLCGNWDYARKNWLYPAGHPGEHAVVGRAPRADGLGYYDCRARWTA